jgi:hypothetical protein
VLSAARRACPSGERGERAGAGGAGGRDEGRRRRDAERHQYYQGGCCPGDRRRAGGAEQGGTGAGEQRRGEPARQQPGGRSGHGHGQVLGQQHGCHEARAAADGLEQPGPPGLVRHPAAGQERDAGYREQPEQPAARLQHLLLVPHQAGGVEADVLPGLEDRRGRGWVGAVVIGGERAGRCRAGELEVQRVAQGLCRGGEPAGIGLCRPDHARYLGGQLRGAQVAAGVAQVRV